MVPEGILEKLEPMEVGPEGLTVITFGRSQASGRGIT